MYHMGKDPREKTYGFAALGIILLLCLAAFVIDAFGSPVWTTEEIEGTIVWNTLSPEGDTVSFNSEANLTYYQDSIFWKDIDTTHIFVSINNEGKIIDYYDPKIGRESGESYLRN